MPTTIYDNSLITKRRRDKTISGSFISRISPWHVVPAGQNYVETFTNQPTTGYAPLSGIYDQSIINTVINGQMTDYRKNDGGCTTADLGCPCNPPTILLNTSIINAKFYVVSQFSDTISATSGDGSIFSPTINPVKAGNISICLVQYDNQQNIQWMTRIGSTTGDLLTPSVLADIDSNVYVSGRTNASSIVFYNNNDPNPVYNLSLIGNQFIWIAKYNANGIFQWAAYLDANYDNFYFTPHITVDTLANVYITGMYYNSTLNIYEANNNVSVNGLTSSGSWGNFLVKYNSGGTYLWSTKILGSANVNVPDIVCDSNNNVFIASFFEATINIYDTTSISSVNTLISKGNRDDYLIKYNSSGVIQWRIQIGGTIFERRANIYQDKDNNIYISGFYNSDPLSFYNYDDTTTISISNGGSDDMYLAKYNSIGVAQWATRISGSSSEKQPYITVDNLNNISVIGTSTSSSIDIFNSGSLSADLTINFNASPTLFLVQFNSTGQVNWGTYMGNNDESVFRAAITSDVDNNLYVTGNYNVNMNFYNSDNYVVPNKSLTYNGSPTVFVTKYDSSGNCLLISKIECNNGGYAEAPSISSSYKLWQ